MGQQIEITYDGTDITRHVEYARTTFESSAGAIPGFAKIVIIDPGQALNFVTGREVTLRVDGQLHWAGYLRNDIRTFPFPADYVPPNPADYRKRTFELQAVDYNVLFDKRVVRNTADYLHALPTQPGTDKDGTLLTRLLNNYIDVPAGFDTSTEMDDVAYVTGDTGSPVAYTDGLLGQGAKLRGIFEKFNEWSGAVYYIRADKKFLWKALEDVVKRWGFSDRPNNATITTTPGFQGVTRGFRMVTGSEDGSPITNDALIWGGSPIGSNGQVIFARREDATSEADHNRWQIGETHFNESPYGVQAGVDARAEAIINGPPGATPTQQLKGLRYSQWAFSFSWYADHVPYLSGVHDHIQCGDLVWIDLETFGTSNLLPCRSLRIGFESLDENGDGIVTYQGDFALNADDPWTLWKFLLGRKRGQQLILLNVTNGSTVTVYGANFQGVPNEPTDGVRTTFTLPFGYIAGTLDVYLNGLLQRPSVNVFESDNIHGEFTMSSAPQSTDNLYVIMRTLAA